MDKKVYCLFCHSNSIPMTSRKEKIHTIHTSRTMMFEEISAIIEHKVFNTEGIIQMNVLGKQTRSNMIKTIKILAVIYDFEKGGELWQVFMFLWKESERKDRRLLTLLYVVYMDQVMRLSIPVVLNTLKGKKVDVKEILETINKAYPGRYAPTTGISAAQNIASSWKQAGYIEGKVSNIRIPVDPGFTPVLFALYLAKRDGLIGADLLTSKWIQILELRTGDLKERLSQAAIRNLIHYQQAGGVTVIKLDNLIKQLKG